MAFRCQSPKLMHVHRPVFAVGQANILPLMYDLQPVYLGLRTVE